MFNLFSRKDISVSVPNYWDIAAGVVIFSSLLLLAYSTHHMVERQALQPDDISLDRWYLLGYAIRSLFRMVLGILFSLVITLVIGTLAAKHKFSEMIILPVIDILQSIPALGYQQMVGLFLFTSFNGGVIGFEWAAVFVIITAQVWNMILSFYQSLKTVPKQYYEVAKINGLSAWQTFWRIEFPFALPLLSWNMMMSLSASWFVVVACEVIEIKKDMVFHLPGLGSYLDKANGLQDTSAILASWFTMFLVIIVFDQLVFRPLNYMTQTEGKKKKPWVVRLFSNAKWVSKGGKSLVHWCRDHWLRGRVVVRPRKVPSLPKVRRFMSFVMICISGFLLIKMFVMLWQLFHDEAVNDVWQDIPHVLLLGLYSSLRVMIFIGLSTLLWLPIGVWIGQRPKVSNWIQPIIQFLASIPPNFLYPFFVSQIILFQLNPSIWLSPLIVLGCQWYILFNVIAGTQMLPKNLHQAAKMLKLSGWLKWKKLILPGLFPSIITGMMAAAGGAWNATVVVEVIKYGDQRISAAGLGTYIVEAGDHGLKLTLGVIVMCLYVLLINRLVWMPLYRYAEQHFKHEG